MIQKLAPRKKIQMAVDHFSFRRMFPKVVNVAGGELAPAVVCYTSNATYSIIV